MKFSFETTAYRKDGVMLIRNKTQLEKEALGSGLNEFDVIIKGKSKSRSVQINRYYWGVVVVLVRDAFRDLGNEVGSQETHEFLKMKFNYKELINEETGEVILDAETGLPIRLPVSTAKMPNTDFIVYMERIKQFASEVLSIYIPEPNEQLNLL